VRAILAPGGVFLLTVPALMWLWSRHDTANHHFRRYTRATLRRVLEDAGLEIVWMHYFFGWTLGPLLLRRLLAPGEKPGAAPAHYHVKVPAAPVNGIMYTLSRLEQTLLGSFTPVGSSLIALARAKNTPPR